MTCMPSKTSDINVYAQAWGFFHFLCENRRQDLQKYFSKLYEFEPGRRSKEDLRSELTEAFGSLEQLDEQWTQFIEDYLSQE